MLVTYLSQTGADVDEEPLNAHLKVGSVATDSFCTTVNVLLSYIIE